MSLTNRVGTWVWHSLTWCGPGPAMAETWVWPSLTGRGPGTDTHWQSGYLGLTFTDGAGEPGCDNHRQGGGLGLTLTDRAGTWAWHSLTEREPGCDTHWQGGTWGWHSLTRRGPGFDTHWQGGDLGLTLTDRAGTWVWRSLPERGPGYDTHWQGGDLGVTLTDRAGTWVWHPHWRGGNPVPAMSVSVRPRSPPCHHAGPRPVSGYQTQVPVISVSVRPRSPPCQRVSDTGPALLVAGPDGSFVSTGACNLVRIPFGPDICHRGWAYTVLQTVQRHGLYSAAYGTVHY